MKRAAILAILGAILAAVVILAVGCGGNGGGYSEAEAVKVEATRQAMAFQAEREALNLERQKTRAQSVDMFLMALPWVVLVAGLAAAGLVLWRWLQVWEARARLVHRAPEAGETILTLGRGERFALPLRSAGVYQDLTRGAERAPLLAASAEAQDWATGRQQAANLSLASQVGKVVKALRGVGDVHLMLPPEEKREPARALPARARVEPGLLGPVNPDGVPPKLLEAVVSQWEEIDDGGEV